MTPDPLYARACEEPSLRASVQTIYAGRLSEEQAEKLNHWLGAGHSLEQCCGVHSFCVAPSDLRQARCYRFTTSTGEGREIGVTSIGAGARYSWAAFPSWHLAVSCFVSKLIARFAHQVPRIGAAGVR